jgi:uncharacterized membrane protein
MTVPAPVTAGSITARAARVDSRIARVLRVGTLVSIGLLAIGVALMIVAGRSPLDGSWPALDLGRIPGDLLALRPEGFLWLGLLTTLATPLVRVAAAVIEFIDGGERRMAALGITVLFLLALAVVVAERTAG